MENQYLDMNVQADSNDWKLSSLDNQYLYTAAKWSRFLGIIGFVFTGIIVIGAFSTLFLGNPFTKLGNDNPYSSSVFANLSSMIIAIYVVIGVVYFFISRFLYNFGTQTKHSIDQKDGAALTEGLKNLKSYFNLVGILVAIVAAIYALIIIFAIGAALFFR